MPTPRLLEGDAFRDPNNTGPRKCHSIPNGGVWSVYSETKIHAPVAAVVNAILDIERWSEWNTFVYHVKITSHPHSHHKNLWMEEGTDMIFSVKLTDEEKTTSKETCTHVGAIRTLENHGPPALTHIRWSMHNAALMVPSFVIKAERTNEMEDVGGGVTIYRTWVVFGGLFANQMKKRYEQILKDRFRDMSEDLKRYVEGKQQATDGTDKAGAAGMAETQETTAKDGGDTEVVPQEA